MRSPFLAVLLLLASFPSAASAQAGNARAEALAKRSEKGRAAAGFVKAHARKIRDARLEKAVLSILDNPVPTFMERYAAPERRQEVRDALEAAGLLEASITTDALFPRMAKDPAKAPQSFLAAPGHGDDGHHAWPGGLAEHTAFNLQAALDLEDNYRKRFGVRLDHDLVIAAPILHDAFKPWTLQWNADGTLTKEIAIAGTGAHHVFAIAEALHRKLPAGFVVALASAHAPPTGGDAAKVVDWLRAAATLAGQDPIESRVLVPAGEAFVPARLPSIEAAVNYLADHDYVITIAAADAVAEALLRLARAEAGERTLEDAQLRWMRHRINSRVNGMLLYQWLREGGDARVKQELAARKIPLLDASDAPTE